MIGKRALIVDDTKNIRLMLSKCLELEGYQVQTAADGKAALEAIQPGAFDLIFLDIKLPEISGTEVLRRIRSEGIQTPVVVITAYPTVKNAVECTRMGTVAYMQKPFTAQRLKSTINTLEQRLAGTSGEGLEAAEEALERGDLLRAKDLFQSVLAKTPGSSVVYERLAHIYEQLGDRDNSEKFRRAAKIFAEK